MSETVSETVFSGLTARQRKVIEALLSGADRQTKRLGKLALRVARLTAICRSRPYTRRWGKLRARPWAT